MSLVSARTIVSSLKFVVVHKLTNQPVRSHYKPFNIIEHETIDKANEIIRNTLRLKKFGEKDATINAIRVDISILEEARPYLKNDFNKTIQLESSLEILRGKPYRDWETDRKSTRLNSSHSAKSRMPSSA